MHCNCGGGLVRKHVADHDISATIGLSKVTVSGELLVCDRCGEVALEGEVIERTLEGVALMLVEHRVPMAPQVVRFARKYLGLTQEGLAARLEVERTTIARWETARTRVSGPEALAIRALLTAYCFETKVAPDALHLDKLTNSFNHPSRIPPMPRFIDLGNGTKFEPAPAPT